ncbi:MAG: CHAD domain-containing protein [Chthoniobacterales bacterium]|nr:CHAD domain-containing protein [Chthoniobacterales bacterium]
MSYQLEPGEIPSEGVRRIAREQLQKSLEEISKLQTAKTAKSVHSARKHIKKIRALLRLICDQMGEEIFAEENRRLRDIGQSLSGARDAAVQLQVLRKLRERASQPKAAFRLTTALLRREIAAASHDLGAEQQAARTTLQAISDRIEGWPLDGLTAENLSCALHRFYRRGRRALRLAEKDPTAENFHRWRKRVKDVWYQALLLQPLQLIVLDELAAGAKTLGRHLGELHDLAFFRARLETTETLPEPERALLLGLICARESELQEIVLDLGARFFAEKPKDFAKRLLRYAKKWPAPPLPNNA